MFTLEHLQEELTRAKKRALEGVRVFDIYRNRWAPKPDLIAHTKLLEIEARVVAALSATQPHEQELVSVSAAELQEIVEGLERNDTTESARKPTHASTAAAK